MDLFGFLCLLVGVVGMSIRISRLESRAPVTYDWGSGKSAGEIFLMGLVGPAALAIGVLYVMANPGIGQVLGDFAGVALFVGALMAVLTAWENYRDRKKSLVNPDWRKEAEAHLMAEKQRRIAERIALSERRSRAVAKFLERLAGRRIARDNQ